MFGLRILGGHWKTVPLLRLCNTLGTLRVSGCGERMEVKVILTCRFGGCRYLVGFGGGEVSFTKFILS
jgi:hypothetical protein